MSYWSFLIVNGEYHQHGCLSLLRSHTDFGYLGRQQTLSHGNAVLYVNGGHIRVCTLFEVNGNFGGTVIGCTGSHVHHVLHTVDLVSSGAMTEFNTVWALAPW